jgi:hypothetical protein
LDVGTSPDEVENNLEDNISPSTKYDERVQGQFIRKIRRVKRINRRTEKTDLPNSDRSLAAMKIGMLLVESKHEFNARDIKTQQEFKYYNTSDTISSLKEHKVNCQRMFQYLNAKFKKNSNRNGR